MAALVICGCTEPGLFVDVTSPSAVEALTLRVKDQHRVLATQTFDAPTLPGSVFVRLNDAAGRVTVVGASTMPALLGAATAPVDANGQRRVSLALERGVDEDGDGWPDAFDVCPTRADPEQLDVDGDGRGDACASTDGGTTDAGATDGGATDRGATDGGATDGGATDGGATDGGATDAGATDGGATDGGAGCDGGAFVSCFDFERPSTVSGFGDATWARVTDVVARGRTALRVDRDAGIAGYAGRWVELGFAPATRFHFRLRAISAPFTLVDVNDTSGSGIFVLAVLDGGLSLTHRVTRASEGVPFPLEAERWYCLELRHTGQPVTSTEVRIDGQLRRTVTQVGAWTANRSLIGPAFDESGGGTVWVDDAASAAGPIGCD